MTIKALIFAFLAASLAGCGSVSEIDPGITLTPTGITLGVPIYFRAPATPKPSPTPKPDGFAK